MHIIDLSTLLLIIGTLMGATNIITEVLKQITWNKVPTNALVVIIAEVLTLASGAAYAEICAVPVVWYHIVAAVVLGLFVAYAAMFGFDKLKQTLEQRGETE